MFQDCSVISFLCCNFYILSLFIQPFCKIITARTSEKREKQVGRKKQNPVQVSLVDKRIIKHCDPRAYQC
jgi:hypothetical protein